MVLIVLQISWYGKVIQASDQEQIVVVYRYVVVILCCHII